MRHSWRRGRGSSSPRPIRGAISCRARPRLPRSLGDGPSAMDGDGFPRRPGPGRGSFPTCSRSPRASVRCRDVCRSPSRHVPAGTRWTPPLRSGVALGRGSVGCRFRPHRRRDGAWGRAGRLRDVPPSGPPRRARLLRRLVLPQQRRHRRRASAPRRLGRVGIVDLDAHHGNGTQVIFYDRADVVYTSVHIDPDAGWFPHFMGRADEIGAGEGLGANLNSSAAGGSRRRRVAAGRRRSLRGRSRL